MKENLDPEDVKDLKFATVTLTTTRTYTVWKTSTSDVKITSAVLVPLTVTQYSTRRDFEKEDPDTVTSFVRITKTPVVIKTKVVEKFPIRTVVSRLTRFKTVTSTVDLWFPVTHYQTSFEVVRIPEEETQTLVQVEYDTVTSFSSVLVTKLPGKFGFAFGY
ncbi:hypothetical protein Avbf_15863 [Armadillidium vulgare]|nr:hypothetical protein Avbf_15863 [Armadillidium vulgare]